MTTLAEADVEQAARWRNEGASRTGFHLDAP